VNTRDRRCLGDVGGRQALETGSLRPVNRFALLIVPALTAVFALRTGFVPFKLGVPGACGLILWLELRRLPPESRRELWAVIWAFGMSMIGDWFLSNRNGREHFFEAGIGAFFLAHLGYAGYALMNGRLHRPGLMVLLLVFVPYYGFWLAPAIDGVVLNGSVLLYLLISCVALAAAIGLSQAAWVKGLYVAGIGLVVFSDTIISFKEFLNYDGLNGLILPTYYLAHLCVTLSILIRFRPGHSTR
jgi:uncharacterized membrane protein YhhN